MKQFLCAVLLLISGWMAEAQNLTIKANIKGLEPGLPVYVATFDQVVPDSFVTKKNGFVIRLDVPPGEGNVYTFRIGKDYNNGNFLMTYLDKGEVKITGKGPGFTKATLSGPRYLADYEDYKKALAADPVAKTKRALYERAEQLQKQKDTLALAEVITQINEVSKAEKSVAANWIKNHVNSPISVYLLQFELSREFTNDEAETLMNLLTEEAKNNRLGQKLAHTLRMAKLTAVGQPAPVFTQNDTSGKPVSLTDFRGNYVLVDFWASWCVPCRAENPHVVSAFKKYRNKGFTVLGVSFDNPGAHDKWLKAIHDDGLTWTHVSDLKGWKNEVGVLYDIHSIPQNLLIGPDGIILAKNLRGEQLENKLREFLGEPTPETSGELRLKGTLRDVSSDYVRIFITNEMGEMLQDSVKIVGGSFEYKATLAHPQELGLAAISATTKAPVYLRFFVDPGDVTVEASVDNPKALVVKGSRTHDEYTEMQKLFVDVDRRAAPFEKKYELENNRYMDASRARKGETELAVLKAKAYAAREALMSFYDEKRQITLDYMRNNPQSFVTASLARYYVNEMSVDSAQAMYDRMGEAVQKSAYGNELCLEIAKLKSGSPGSMATEFSGMGIDGKPLKLSDFRGKYVLLDFWASWCVPCRAGNPHLLKLYAKYKLKGFEIIGISDDDGNPDAWKKAVAKDKIGVWKHVLRGLKRTSDGGFDRSEDRSEAYGIHSLPTKILIDPNGMIIGRYGGGGESDEAMDKKLAEIFGSYTTKI